MKVIELNKSNFRDIAKTLRNIADEIEANSYGEVCDVALVVQGEKLQVFHAGMGDSGTVHLLLACGQRKMEHAVLSQTGGYNFGN